MTEGDTEGHRQPRANGVNGVTMTDLDSKAMLSTVMMTATKKAPPSASCSDDYDDDGKAFSSSLSDSTDSEEADLGAGHDQQAKIIGGFGPWQFTISLITAFSIIIHAWQMMANKFLTYPTEHWCSRELSFQGADVQQWLNISAPRLPNGEFDRCQRFDLDYSDLSIIRPNEDTPTIPCTSWEYDDSIFQNSAVQRWDLVCERQHFRRVVQMFFFFGNMIGVLAVGPLSDWFGRKTAYMTMLTLWMLFGIAGHFASDPYLWLVIRFFCGATSLAYNTAISVYRIELSSGKWRSRVTHYFGELFWQLGHMSLGLLVYLIPNMYHLELCIGLAALPFMPLWYFMPESPRWLLTKGRLEEAKQVLRGACKLNGRPTEPVNDLKVHRDHKTDRTAHLHHLFRMSGVRRNSVIICICWMAFSMGYFGLVYNTPAFEANLYLVFVVPAFFAIPAIIFQPFMDNYFGRKRMMTIPLLGAGTILLLTMAVPRGEGYSPWPIIILAWVGQFLCGVAFGTGYVFTQELFPTSYRTLALSMASAGARIGSISSPLIAMLDVVHPILPLVVYGSIVLAAGIQSIWLWPETAGVRFTHTLEEAEKLASSPNAWLTCCQGKASADNKPAENGITEFKKQQPI